MIASTLSYKERAAFCLAQIAQRLLELMDAKQKNLALSADVTSSQELIRLADELGPEICILKTHIDIISDFTPNLTKQLVQLARKHDFLIFEDRKFADIGNTVKQQYSGGIYRIADWADMVNAHSLPGPGIIKGLQSASPNKMHGLILLAEMSSDGHLMNKDYIQSSLVMAKHFQDFVFGFITQRALSTDPQWIYLTPGVKLDTGIDTLGQKYITPETAIVQNGSDVIIVGRGIIAAKDPLTAAKRYRQAGWDAYEQRTHH
jgi:uridine monophosphate synthetase